MKPISLATFIGGMLILGISLIWFPDIVNIIAALMPVGTPDYFADFLAILPYILYGVALVALTKKLAKRGSPKGFDQNE